MDSRIEARQSDAAGEGPDGPSLARQVARHAPSTAASRAPRLRVVMDEPMDMPRFPRVLTPEEFYPQAYPAMFLSRQLEGRLLDLFRKGYVKGTVTSGAGNEATAVGAAMPFRPNWDISALLHRDFAAHMILGATPYQMVCQYLANADSPTHGREGNVHHGDAQRRRMPMMSHLGRMLSVAVGGAWAARRNGEDSFALAMIGDGGSSSGEFHEAINLAAVHRVPVLFLIQNNHYS
ncbi:MAG: thiamine pyrophosphate-dependent enzyme, partial [Patescibacteria group bacterium]|nr:thiamine pyrophosphate-dependent enzyme [Patescibacteria group bacterium]